MAATSLSHHRHIPLRHASFLRATLCLLVFLGVYQWSGSTTTTSNSPGAAESLNDYPSSPDTSYPPRAGDVGAPPVVQKPSKPSHGRIVVTGGGGNIGKPIVQRLLASGKPVTTLDKLFYPDELDSLSPSLSYPPSYTSKSPLLKVHIGDIRNTTLLSEIFTSDVVGVVHLAAVSRVLWCLENEADCWDVNQRGTQLVLDALTNLNAKDSGKRWFVLASSREVYGNPLHDNPTTEDMERKPANVYGASKLAAENVVTKHLDALNTRRAPGTLRVIALRLSNIYGGVYDHLERLIPSITTQALSHQVIQISGGQQNLDLVHIDDCVEAFLLAVARLTKSISPWFPPVLPFSSRTSFEAFNVASGESAKATSVVSTILRLTRSQSPLQTITGDTRFPNVYKGSTVKASAVLGFKAKVGVKEGLGRFVKAYMRRTSTFLEEKIKNSCGPRTITTVEAPFEPEEILSMNNVPPQFVVNNQQLDKLNGCSVHIVMNIDGELTTLGPSPEPHNNAWTATRDMPPFQFYTSTSRHSSRDGRSNVLIRIRDQHNYYVGLQDPLPSIGPVAIERIAGDEVEDGDVKVPLGGHALRLTVDWEMRADAESSTIRLFVPGTNRQLVPTFIGGNFTIVESNTVVGEQHGGVGPFRITPLCCSSPAPWPFVADDPIDFTVEYQRTSLARPFLASPAKALCLRLQRALRKIKAETASLPVVELRHPALHSKLGIDVAPKWNWSSRAIEWSKADLPACSNVCDHPTICVDTGDCQCVLSSCSPRARFPFSSYANLPVLSYPPSATTEPGKSGSQVRESLVDMVKRSSWRNVLRAQASRLISVNTSLAQIYVAPVSESDRLFRENWTDEGGNKKDIGALGETHCMSADDQMEKALERMHVEPQDAEMTFVRHYQGRHNGDNRLDNTYDHARKNTPGFDSSRVVVPFTHHWGQCLAFEGTVWALREKVGLRVDSVVRSSTAWSVVGDLNSPCYRPHQDVVIPPRTCLSPHLWHSFKDMRNVKPARDRPVLVAFRGTPSGTGTLHGARLQCNRTENRHEIIPGRRLHPDGPVLATEWDTVSHVGDYDYVKNAIFCPQPAGITGWSAHLASSVYAGCIPVLIGEASHYPFFDVIDWAKISVRVDINELSHLEEVLLLRYTLDDIEKLQTNLMLVRNAFIYPLDDAPEEDAQRHMLEERGPLFFALQSTKMKLLTKWPTTDVYDRP